MAFINKNNPIPVNIKLTTEGRKRLAQGNFNVEYFSVGDSEMNYKFYNDNNIDPLINNTLVPFDNIDDIKYPIKKSFNSNVTQYNIRPLPSKRFIVNDHELGFFSGDDIYNMGANNEGFYVKEPNLKIDISQLATNNNRTLSIKVTDMYVGLNDVEVNDYLLVNWINPIITNNENFKEGIFDSDNTTPFIWYKIIDLSGSTSTDNLVVTVDRDLPNFGTLLADQYISYCMVFPKFDSIKNYYGSEFLSDYWSFTDDELIENCYSFEITTPVWNLTLFYPNEFIGFDDNSKIPNSLESYKYGGFLEYISEFNKFENEILGIIHYTNSTPNNYIGEGLHKNTPELLLPTIMWHKNKDNKLGVKFKCDSVYKNIEDKQINYYDLIDDNNNVIGKCFPDLKIFLIEDQEILTTISFKSNRNWTLPEIKANINLINC